MELQMFRRVHRIKNEQGGYGVEFDRSHYDLAEIAHVGEYRGFIFGALYEDVPT